MRYLEPGRRRRRRLGPPLTRLLWLVALGIALAIVVQTVR